MEVSTTRWMQRIVASEAIPVLTIRVGPCSLGHVVSDVNHTRVSRVNVPTYLRTVYINKILVGYTRELASLANKNCLYLRCRVHFSVGVLEFHPGGWGGVFYYRCAPTPVWVGGCVYAANAGQEL